MKRQQQKTSCISCNTILHGPYCHKCGEKVVRDHDFTFGKLSEQMIDIFTHVDSRLFLSFYSLVAKPGFLTLEYIRGARKSYMKPFQVFLLCNVLFFVVLGSMDILLIPSKWLLSSQYGSPDALSTAKAIMAEKKISMSALKAIYDAKVSSNSKLFVVLLIPFIALGTWLFGFRQHKEYGKHLVFAVYLLSFFLILTVLWSRLWFILPDSVGDDIQKFLVIGLFMLYLWHALKRFLVQSTGVRIFSTLSIGIWFFGLTLLYRYLISWFTLYLM